MHSIGVLRQYKRDSDDFFPHMSSCTVGTNYVCAFGMKVSAAAMVAVGDHLDSLRDRM